MNTTSWQSPTSFAEAIGLSLDHVYRNVDNYGGVRLGTGDKPPIRIPATDIALANMRQAQAAKLGGGEARAQRACPDSKRTAQAGRVGGPTIPLPVYEDQVSHPLRASHHYRGKPRTGRVGPTIPLPVYDLTAA
jgi:hypothetical protein